MTLTKTKSKSSKVKQLWHLEDGITYSALSTWLRCREQFRLSYVEGWSYPGFVFHLEFGNLFHFLLEHWQNDSSLSHLIGQYKRKFWPPAKRRILAQSDIDEMTRCFGMVEKVFPHYLSFHQEEEQNYKWIGRETSFRLPVQVDGQQILMRGKIDGVYRKKKKERKDSLCRIFETKTKGQIDESSLGDELLADFQTMLYSLAAQHEYGEPIEGIRYNVIRRPGLRVKKNENLKDFLERVEDDVITRPDHYFKRWTVDFSQEDIKNWKERQLEPVLRNFIQWYEGFEGFEGFTAEKGYRSRKTNNIITDPFFNPLHFQGTTESLYIRNAKTHLHKKLLTGKDSSLVMREKVHPELED